MKLTVSQWRFALETPNMYCSFAFSPVILPALYNAVIHDSLTGKSASSVHWAPFHACTLHNSYVLLQHVRWSFQWLAKLMRMLAGGRNIEVIFWKITTADTFSGYHTTWPDFPIVLT